MLHPALLYAGWLRHMKNWQYKASCKESCYVMTPMYLDIYNTARKSFSGTLASAQHPEA